MNELAELEAKFSDVSDELSVWQGLISLDAWERLMVVATGQVTSRVPMLRQPISGVDAAFEQEFVKGEMAGIELFQNLPHTEVERLKAERDRLEKEIADATRDTDAMGADGGSERRESRDILDRDGFGGTPGEG